MRIALVTLDFRPSVGGVQQYLYEVGRRLGRHHDVLILTPVGGPLPPGVRLRREVLASGSTYLFLRALRAARPDRVLVGHAHPRLLLAAAVTAWGRYGTIAYGNDYLAAQRRWHRPLFNRLLGASRPLITISRANAHRLRQLGMPEPAIARPGVDPVRFSPSRRKCVGPPVILTVGRLVPRKGVDTVLQALPQLLGGYPDLCYRVVGGGPDRPRLERMARELGVASAVEFMGQVPDEDLPDVYRSARIFVMPTREERQEASVEGFGIVYLEASASGLPVVAARSGGVAEAVRERRTGVLVPPLDPRALGEALRQLLSDPELCQHLGQAGRQWVEEEMNWEQTALDVCHCLEG